MRAFALMLLIATPALASERCTPLKPADTLILHGKRQHAERFVECILGHWPNVESAFRKVKR